MRKDPDTVRDKGRERWRELSIMTDADTASASYTTDDSITALVPDETYLAWAQDSLGVIIHHPLKVSSTPGKEERGIFCEDDIPAESIIVSVPWEVRVDHLFKYFEKRLLSCTRLSTSDRKADVLF